jgi:NAD(P)-dependent dehydrogenase (short-subunit alcohol dehydrogenase family)
MEQKPRLAIVTGSTTGLGLATATSLWRDYNYHVILAVRDEKKALEATKIISGKDSDERLEFIQIDLANLETVNRFAENFYKKYDYLDLLVNNAGMVTTKLEKTQDGFEKMFQVNHLGHFLLTNRLLPALKNSKHVARIIIIGSDAYKFSGPSNIDEIPVNVDEEKGMWYWSAMRLYGSSKLCNLWFSLALRKKLEEQGATRVTVACMHPGSVRSEIAREAPKMLQPVLGLAYKLFFLSPEDATKPTIAVATLPDTDLTTGQYWSTTKVAQLNKLGGDMDSAMKLWDKSVDLLAGKGYTV